MAAEKYYARELMMVDDPETITPEQALKKIKDIGSLLRFVAGSCEYIRGMERQALAAFVCDMATRTEAAVAAIKTGKPKTMKPIAILKGDPDRDTLMRNLVQLVRAQVTNNENTDMTEEEMREMVKKSKAKTARKAKTAPVRVRRAKGAEA